MVQSPRQQFYGLLEIRGGKIVRASREAAQLAGVPLEALEGRALDEVFSAESTKLLEEEQSHPEGISEPWLRLTFVIGARASVSAAPVCPEPGGNDEFFLILRPREVEAPVIAQEADPDALLVVVPLRSGDHAAQEFSLAWANEAAWELFDIREEEIGQQKRLTEVCSGFESDWLERIRNVHKRKTRETFLSQAPNLGGRYFRITLTSANEAVVCHFADVTEHIHVVEQAQESARRLDEILTVTPVVLRVLHYDEQTDEFVPVWVSPSVEHFLGYRVEEAMEPPWWQRVIDPRDRDWVPQRAREVLAKGQLQLEYRVLTKWGRPVWIQEVARVTAVRDNRPEELLVTWTDITQRVLDTELIHDQLRTLRTLKELSLAIAEEATPQALATTVARKCVEVLGASLAWIGLKEIDGSVKVLSYWPPEHTYPKEIQVRWDNSALAQGPGGRCLTTGQVINIPDALNDPAMAPWQPALQRHNLKSVIGVSLIHRRETLGCLLVYADKAGFFSGWRGSIIQDLAPLIAAELAARLAASRVQLHLEELEGLRRIDLQIIHEPEPQLVIGQVLEECITKLGVDAAAFVELHNGGTAHVLCHRGFKHFPPDAFSVGEGGVRRRIYDQRSRIILENFWKCAEEFALTEFFLSEGFVWYCGEPVIVGEKVYGILEIFSRQLLTPDAGWFKFVETLAGQGAIGLELASNVKQLRQSRNDLRQAYEATMQGWVRALEYRDKETEGHSQRVTELTLRLARASGVKEEDIPHIERGALLHDVGKIGVPDAILYKPGPLTDEEWAIMRRHPTMARDLLWPIEYLRPAIDIPYCHHEKWDGTGYPQGLKGEAIPWAARIFAVVDVWDALLSDRPYRKAWSEEKTLEYIVSLKGTHFDPRAVDLFLEEVVKKR
jgi:PAS domain S-box-containing protein